jgi:hypothetical protein
MTAHAVSGRAVALLEDPLEQHEHRVARRLGVEQVGGIAVGRRGSPMREIRAAEASGRVPVGTATMIAIP